MTHTPTPWSAHEKGVHPNPYICGPTVTTEHGDDQFVVAYIVGTHTEANAAFIVRAVNSHEKLVEVLRKFMDYSDSEYVPNALFERARAALEGLE